MNDIIHQDHNFSYIPSTSGIYAIVNIINQQMYIGSAKDLKQRAHLHLHRLAVGNHQNVRLRRASVLFGPDAFRFDILEHVAHVKDLLTREQYYINKLKPQYNTSRFASRNLGMMVRKRQPANLQAETQIGEEKEQTAPDIRSDIQIWMKMDRLLDKAGLVSSEKTMVAAMLAFADNHGITVSCRKLAEYQGYTDRQVYNITRSLREKGLILVTQNFREDKGQVENTYDLSPLYQKLERLIP